VAAMPCPPALRAAVAGMSSSPFALKLSTVGTRWLF
jgi:hypothetical protein